MKYTEKTEEILVQGRSAVTLGKFESLHRGHCRLIEQILEQKKLGYRAVVFTFDVSPAVSLENSRARGILTNAERRQILSEKGIDELIEYPFELVRQMSAEEFVRKILVEKLHTASVVVGPDYHFGYQRQGNPQLLKELGAQYGFEVQILEKEKDGDRDISSTYIRQMLADGNVEKAAKLLGYSYFVKGTVQHGRALGRTIGIPTINQLPSKAKLLPRFGVYATKTQIGNRRYCGISNVGVKPTVEGRFAGVETHLFSCTQDLYEQDAYVEFLHFLRPEQKFSDVEELKKQIQRDMEQAERLFGLRHSCEL